VSRLPSENRNSITGNSMSQAFKTVRMVIQGAVP